MITKSLLTTRFILSKSTLPLVFVLLLSQACSNSGGTGPMDLPVIATDPILPLAVGNRWTWLISTYDTLGNLLSSRSDSLRIDSVLSFQSQSWYFPGQPYLYLAFSNSVGGCYYRAFSDSVGSCYLFYRYPASVGSSYRAPQGIVSGNHVWIEDTLQTMTVVSTDTTITVPAGTFRCYLYRRAWNRGWYYYDEFLSPKCGWVRTVTYAERPFRRGIFLKYGSQDLTQFVQSR